MAESLADSATFSDTLTVEQTPNRYYHSLVEQMAGQETITTEQTPNRWVELLTSTLTGSEQLVYGTGIGKELLETLTLREANAFGWGKTAADTLTVSDTVTKNLGLLLREWMTFTAGLSTTHYGNAALSDTMWLKEQFYQVYEKLLADSLTCTDAVTRALGVLLTEIVQAGDTISPNWHGTQSLTELLNLLDSVRYEKGAGFTLADSLTATDTATLGLYLSCLVTELATLADENTVLRTAPVTLHSSLTISGTVTSNATLNDTLADEVRIITTVKLFGEEYQCWSFTGQEFKPSLYTNYNFNSFAAVGPQMFAAKDDGIYLLGGTTDAGAAISTGIRLDFRSMGTHLQKRMFHAFFGLVGDNPVLKVVVDGDDDASVQYYVVNGRAHLAKGVAGREWELTLTDIDALSFVELYPVVLTR